MLKLLTHTIELSGSNYEAGYQLGKVIDKYPELKAKYFIESTDIDIAKVQKEIALLDHWCPGLNEEIKGFSDALQIKTEQLYFYTMSYLSPHCSQLALLSNITKQEKPLLARNYEFSHELEDFCLIKTNINGKYCHLGTSMLLFGRDDGFNEAGLAVTMSSCGMPVVNLPNMQKPKISGLRYWIVVRALLENCKNVNEAISYLQQMPIAFNMNLILLDKTNHSALIQIIDGEVTIKQINQTSLEQSLYATNHPILPTSKRTNVFSHSIHRIKIIQKFLKDNNHIITKQLKELLLLKYPQGLCFHNYTESFGTTKSMIIFPVDQTIELCWGGQLQNHWYKFNLNDSLPNKTNEIKIMIEETSKGLFDWQELEKGKYNGL